MNPGHRQRLLDAMVDVIVDRGYASTTVAEIVARARASRRTFYQYFPDREAALVALFADSKAVLVRDIVAAVDPVAPWQVQVRQAIEAWITRAESRPSLMVSWIRDVPALGVPARRLQRDAMEGFIVMVRTLSSTDELLAAGIEPVSRSRALMLIGGLRELTASTVESGGRLSDLLDEVVDAAVALLQPLARAVEPVAAERTRTERG